MLENPKYKGWYCGNKTQSMDYRTKKKAFLDESEWVTYPDPNIPPIVSEELWDRANALYKERSSEVMSKSSGESYHNRYPYSCKIICEEHGTTYHRHVWDRANALYKERSSEVMSKSSGESYHNRYPYSCKIICEEHGTTYHRHVLKKKAGDEEAWQCKIYRTYGGNACSSPQIRSCELDAILGQIFTELVKDKQSIIDSLVMVLVNVPKEVDYGKLRSKVQSDIAALHARKDRILDLQIAGAIIDSLVMVLVNVPKEVDYGKLRSKVQSDIAALHARKDRILDLQIAGAIDINEFKVRNDACNQQLMQLEAQLTAIAQEQLQAAEKDLDIDEIRKALEKELDFSEGIRSALVATILDKVIVKKESTKEDIHLEILDIDEIRKALEKELDFSEGIRSALVATILDKVIVKKESTKEDIHLEIFLKLGQIYAAVYDPKNYPASVSPARNTTHRNRSRRI